MRNANFKLPMEQDLKTGKSSYKAYISDVTADNKLAGEKAQLLTNLKGQSVQVYNKEAILDSATE